METILIIYTILLCLTQIEVLVLVWQVAMGRGIHRSSKQTEEAEQTEDAEKAWRDTLSQLLDYSAETARKAAREEE